MFWRVSNYNLRPMEKKTNLRIVFFLSFLTSLCKSQDYDYTYDQYNYDRNYDYNNQISEDYTDDYNEE